MIFFSFSWNSAFCMHFIVQNYYFPASPPISSHDLGLSYRAFPLPIYKSASFQLLIFCCCSCNVFSRFISVILNCIKVVQQNRSFPKISLLSWSHGACDVQPVPGAWLFTAQGVRTAWSSWQCPGPQLWKTLISFLALLLIFCVSHCR